MSKRVTLQRIGEHDRVMTDVGLWGWPSCAPFGACAPQIARLQDSAEQSAEFN
ncbi:MAG: hypothetical protein JO371_13715 [Paraburkholderia sp.]|nr:hypothetical protein [Paraburkholderia sp.]